MNKKNIIVVILIFAVSSTIFAADDIFTGIWIESAVVRNPATTAYLSITKTGDNEYFVIHNNPYNHGQFDYGAYGTLLDDGSIEVKRADISFYIKHYNDALFHFKTNEDTHPVSFERVTDKQTYERSLEPPEMSLDDFAQWLKMQQSE